MIRLYELRAEKNLSQREMAKAMQVSQATYNNWENSKTQPSIEQLVSLADFFDVSVDYLIGRTTDEGFSSLPIENEILSSYRALDEEGREAIKHILQKMQNRIRL